VSVALNLTPELVLKRKAQAAAAGARWRAKNLEKVALKLKKWRKANLGKEAARAKEWRKLNPGRTAAQKRWDKKNKHKRNEYRARRNAAKINATPKWANRFFIQEIYDLATLRTKITGIRWEVDHVIPLRGVGVCGLHCEGNLQVITAVENNKKGNRV